MPALPGAPPSLSHGPTCLPPLPGPWLSLGLSAPASLLTEKWQSWACTLPPSPLPPADPPAPVGKTRVCVGRGPGVRLNRELRAVGGCRSPAVPAPCGLGRPQCPFRAVHYLLCGRLAGSICLSVCCWCAYAWGRSAGAPSPRGPRSVYAGAPKPALCPCVLALWFCVSVCVCFLVLWPMLWSLCLCGCAMVSMSLHHPRIHLGSVCPSLCWCCALGYSREREDSAAAPPINPRQTASFSSCAESSEGGKGLLGHVGTDRITPQRVAFHCAPAPFPASPSSPPSGSHSDVGWNLPGPLLPSPASPELEPGSLAQGDTQASWAWL